MLFFLTETKHASIALTTIIYLKEILMKKLNLLMLCAVVLVLSSCSVITGIFKAGAFVGILAVLIVIGLIFWIVSMFKGGGN